MLGCGDASHKGGILAGVAFNVEAGAHIINNHTG